MSRQAPTEPWEILELRNRESITITPTRFVMNRDSIHPQDRPAGIMKEIDILTVYYDKKKGEPGVNFWDITSSTLIYQLWPLMPSVIKEKKSIKISAVGEGKKKRFTTEVV